MRASEVVVRRLSCPAAYGTSVLLPGIEPVSPCIEKQILNLWTTKEVPGLTHSWCVDKTGVCACISEDQPHTTEYSDLTTLWVFSQRSLMTSFLSYLVIHILYFVNFQYIIVLNTSVGALWVWVIASIQCKYKSKRFPFLSIYYVLLILSCLYKYIHLYIHFLGFSGGSDSKESAWMQDNPIQFLHWEDLLEKG